MKSKITTTRATIDKHLTGCIKPHCQGGLDCVGEMKRVNYDRKR